MEPRRESPLYHVAWLTFFAGGAGWYVAHGIYAWLWLPLLFVLAHGIALCEKRPTR